MGTKRGFFNRMIGQASLLEGWLRADDAVRRRQQTLAVMAVLTLAAFAIRTYHLDFQSFWRDEVDAVVFARESLPALLAKFTTIGENGPLYFTILHYWIGLVGDSEFALRFFSVAFGVVSVPLTFAAGTRLVGRGTGLIGSLLATISPYYVWYSQEAKMYALLATLSLLSVYLFLRALEENRKGLWLLFVAVTSFSLYVHFFSALILVAEGAIFLAGWGRYRPCIRGAVLSFGALTLPYLPLAVWQLPLLANPPASAYEFVPLEAIGTSLLFAFSAGFSGGDNVIAVVVFTFLLLCAAVFGHKENGSRWHLAVLLLYLMVPLLVFYVVSLRYAMFTERYLIIILPAFQIAAAAGLVVILRRSIMLFVGCTALLIIFSGGSIYTMQHKPLKADFRAAVRYAEAKLQASDSIMTVMPYMRRSFDYYHRGPYRWIEPPYANQGVTEAEVAAEMQAATGAARGIWVFAAEEGFWDQRGLIRGWLDGNAQLLDQQDFMGVKLRYYQLPAREE